MVGHVNRRVAIGCAPSPLNDVGLRDDNNSVSGCVSLLYGERSLAWAVVSEHSHRCVALLFSLLADSIGSAALPTRVVVSLSAIVPSGVLMRFGFPTGMQNVNGIDHRPTPWFWSRGRPGAGIGDRGHDQHWVLG
jgi:hypothetical protein